MEVQKGQLRGKSFYSLCTNRSWWEGMRRVAEGAEAPSRLKSPDVRPVVFRGAAASWKAIKWTDDEDLLRRKPGGNMHKI